MNHEIGRYLAAHRAILFGQPVSPITIAQLIAGQLDALNNLMDYHIERNGGNHCKGVSDTVDIIAIKMVGTLAGDHQPIRDYITTHALNNDHLMEHLDEDVVNTLVSYVQQSGCYQLLALIDRRIEQILTNQLKSKQKVKLLLDGQ